MNLGYSAQAPCYMYCTYSQLTRGPCLSHQGILLPPPDAPDLSIHLCAQEYGLEPALVGLVFFAYPSFFTLLTPLVGLICQKVVRTRMGAVH